MKPRLSRTTLVEDGGYCYNSIQETDCYWLVHPFKTPWLSCGPSCISSCPGFSIPMNNSRSGSLKISNNTHWLTKVKSTSINWEGYTWSWNHSCSVVWRTISSWKLDLRLNIPIHAWWHTGRKSCINGSRASYRPKTCSSWLKARPRWKISWIWSCNSGRFVIILNSLKGGSEEFHLHGKSYKLECNQTHSLLQYLSFALRWRTQSHSSFLSWYLTNASWSVITSLAYSRS